MTPSLEALARVDALQESCRHAVLVMICRDCLAVSFTEQAREIEGAIAERNALRSYILQSGGSEGLLGWIATHGAGRVERLERVAAAAREHRHGGCTVGHHELDDSLAALRTRAAAQGGTGKWTDMSLGPEYER